MIATTFLKINPFIPHSKLFYSLLSNTLSLNITFFLAFPCFRTNSSVLTMQAIQNFSTYFKDFTIWKYLTHPNKFSTIFSTRTLFMLIVPLLHLDTKLILNCGFPLVGFCFDFLIIHLTQTWRPILILSLLFSNFLCSCCF